MTLVNRNVGQNAWAAWKRNALLGLGVVTDLYIADNAFFNFNPDSSHADIWRPIKSSIPGAQLTVQSTPMQYNSSGWPGGQSYLSGMTWRGDMYAAALAGSVPFSIGFEFSPTICPPSSMVFWMNAGTSNTKAHFIQYVGAGAQARVSRGDGATTKTLPTNIPMSLGPIHVVVHTYDGVLGRTWLDGVEIDQAPGDPTTKAGDLFVGPISFTHFALSQAFTTGVSLSSQNACRSIPMGIGVEWNDGEVAQVNAQLTSSGGLA